MSAQYFGAALPLQDALPPLALQDDFPLLAGAAAPPLALQELLPPVTPDAGLFASGTAGAAPPQATAPPMSIPATADAARVFAMFIVLVLSSLLPARPPGEGRDAGRDEELCYVRRQSTDGSAGAKLFLPRAAPPVGKR